MDTRHAAPSNLPFVATLALVVAAGCAAEPAASTRATTAPTSAATNAAPSAALTNAAPSPALTNAAPNATHAAPNATHAAPNATHAAAATGRDDTAALLEIAAEYRKWTRVDEQPNIAPYLCRAPLLGDHGLASQVRVSRANPDRSPHGRKLYFLYAHDKSAYIRLDAAADTPIGVGQAIVKESWTAVPAPPPAPNAPGTIRSDEGFVIDSAGPGLLPYGMPAPIRTVETQDGTRLTTGEQAELFIMLKVAADDAPGTDEGWIYGTVTADGRAVTSVGRVASCMGCHEDAPHERLFGLPRPSQK